jgi:Ca2+-transporting ATPase
MPELRNDVSRLASRTYEGRVRLESRTYPEATMRTLQQIQQLFPASDDNGLSADQLAASRRQFGSNRLTPLPHEPLWKKFIEKFDEPIIKILLAAALLSMFVDLFQGDPRLAGILLAIVLIAVAALYLLRQSQWIPTLMFGSAVTMFFVGLAAGHTAVEGLAVMVAVILATGVAFLSEYKSDREFEALNAQKDALRVKVLREGVVHTVPLEEVAVGEAVLLEMGDEIPADGRMAKATDLFVDQSLMTGESEPVRKQASRLDESAYGPDQPGCVYRGTQVVDGVGLLRVTEVGDATYLGQIARRLSAEEEEEEDESEAEKTETEEKRVKRKLTISKEQTPLQVKLTALADLISNVGYAAAILIFLALLIQGLWGGEVSWYAREGETLGQAFLASGKALLNYFVYMVIIIVVAVPEGLPMSVTVSLALAMRKMTRANSLVRQLVACETVGSATVICSDKTGTLTQNKMQVVRIYLGGHTFEQGSAGWPAPTMPRDLASARPLDWIVLNAGVNSTANLEPKNGKLVTVGNSTEGALLQWLHGAGVEYQKLRLQFPSLYQIHFSSERKRMTTVTRAGADLIVLAKGAPEWVLEHSTRYLAEDGSVRPWTEEVREAVRASLRDAASQAMRTLAFGYSVLPAQGDTSDEELHARRDALESDLVFAGYIAIRDPLRDDVKDAVLRCRQAGIEVKMITGDNVETARAIAYEIGLIDRRDAPIDTPDAVVLTSPQFNELYARLDSLRKIAAPTESEVREREGLIDQLVGLRVLARAQPLDKFKMVQLLQSRDQVVAVTGDGTNDAPALKKADVGLAMGIAGTEVAKEASKIVLLDDAFSTIVKAVHWGRSLYENIQRFIQFQLTINVSALTIAFLGPFFGVKPPFTVLQLLWINVIMDTFASIALCSEPPREGLMDMPPKRKDENILTPAMIRTIFITAAFFVVVMMTLLAGMEWGGWFQGDGARSEKFDRFTLRQVTIFFTAYVFFQVWNQINCRSLVPEASGLVGLSRNPTFLTIAGTIAVVQILIVSVPFLGGLFEVEPLGWRDWFWILLGTSSVLAFAEAARRIRLLLAPAPTRKAVP